MRHLKTDNHCKEKSVQTNVDYAELEAIRVFDSKSTALTGRYWVR